MGKLTQQSALQAALEYVGRRRPSELQAITEEADRIRTGSFCVLNSRVDFPPRSIPWNEDFLSGYRWPVKFHTEYRYADLLDYRRASDVKVPWELSRLQFLPTLSLAYRITDDPLYAKSARELLTQFDRANPVGYGLPWAVAMEASLRAVSIVLAAEFLAQTPGESTFVDRRLVELLYEHGRFIYRNVEFSDINGNHYTACLLGLLYLALYLEGQPETADWQHFALQGLQREICTQVYPDGVCHEGSIPYHRLVLEMFLHAALLCRNSNIDLGAEYATRLTRMVEFTHAYTKPNGMAPVWGDADDGRVHKLSKQDTNDHRYLLTIGSILLERPDLYPEQPTHCLDCYALLDHELLKRAKQETGAPEEAKRSQGFPHGGIFILRNSSDFVLIDCGDVGLRGRGGHGHHDTLSVEVCLDGQDIIVDTGCASYTADLVTRKRVVSATAHNAPVVDEREPGQMEEHAFVTAGSYQHQLVTWEPSRCVFGGSHLGYRPLRVDREVGLSPGRVIILDRIQGRGAHQVRWLFHLAPQWKRIGIDGGSAFLHDSRDRTRFRFTCASAKTSLDLSRTPFYPSYGVLQQRWCISAVVRCNLPLEERFELSTVEGPE